MTSPSGGLDKVVVHVSLVMMSRWCENGEQRSLHIGGWLISAQSYLKGQCPLYLYLTLSLVVKVIYT